MGRKPKKNGEKKGKKNNGRKRKNRNKNKKKSKKRANKKARNNKKIKLAKAQRKTKTGSPKSNATVALTCLKTALQLLKFQKNAELTKEKNLRAKALKEAKATGKPAPANPMA